MQQPTDFDWSYLYKNEEKFVNKIVLEAKVVHGFKRGSKELGIPTANLCMEELGDKGENLKTGIYYGWAILRNTTYQAVISVGWNPYYKNQFKTVEAYLIHELDDFYDENLKLNLCGYLRNECDFKSLGFIYLNIIMLYNLLFLMFYLYFVSFILYFISYFRRIDFLHKIGYKIIKASINGISCCIAMINIVKFIKIPFLYY
jgi:riboflavin kinase